MSDKLVLFSGDMVRAILDRRKRMTRRIVKPQPHESFFPNGVIDESTNKNIIKHDFVFGNRQNVYESTLCKYFRCNVVPGDVFLVKETHAVLQTGEPGTNSVTGAYVPFDPIIVYRADGWEKPNDAAKLMSIDTGHKWHSEDNKWKPSLFMPKKFARIRLPITRIRMERLHDITAEDAIAEGIECVRSPSFLRAIFWRDYTGKTSGYLDPVKSFMSLWESIYGLESVDQNPFVWVIEFEEYNG